MDRDELNVILEVHKTWLETKDTNKVFGKCADLRGTNLSGIDLRGIDLSYADLRGTNLKGTNLSGTDLRGANLRDTDLEGTNLRGTDLRGTNLNGMDLSGAILTNVKYDEGTAFLNSSCPEKGSFIGYKKARNNTIVELLITEDALRSSATSRKCRCSKAKVLSITNIDGTKYSEDYVYSNYDKNFIYKVDEIVEVKDFNINRWNECSTGIHFFITRAEAVNYN